MDTATQQNRLLREMQINPLGVNSYYATFQMGIKQAPTRIKELKKRGYQIVSMRNTDRSVNWIFQKFVSKEVLNPVKPQKYWITDIKTNSAREVTKDEYDDYMNPGPTQGKLI